MNKTFNLALILGLLFLLNQCGSSTDDTDDTSTSDYVSASGEVGDVSSGGSTGLSLANTRKDVGDACPSIAFSACTSKVKERAFSLNGGNTEPCTRGKSNGRRVFGKAILTFSADDCAFTEEDATITRTLSNHYVQRGLNGKKVIIYTGTGTVADKNLSGTDMADYEGTTRQGGAVLKKGAETEDKLTVLGIHRRGLNPNGKFGFWHTLWTEEDGITVVRSGSGDSATATLNGKLYIMHNRAKIKITKTLKDVKYVKSCMYPTSGTETIEIPGSATVTATFTSSCGLPTIDNAESTLDTES